MKIILAVLIATITTVSFAATIDDQIAAAKVEEAAASRLAHSLASQKASARIDSLFQADSTLAADKVRVTGGDKDSMWVKLALDKLSALDLKIVKAELKGADLDFQATPSPDTLYMRRDRAEKALPVISNVLKGE